MAYIMCPGCDGLNYMDEKEELCPTCKNKTNRVTNLSKNMNSATADFVFKRGTLLEYKIDINELSANKGKIYILVFDNDNQCIGYVFSHDEKSAPAHGQAEIAFWGKYQKEYGQWHRIFIGRDGKERLKFIELNKILDEQSVYNYLAYLNFVKNK